MKFFVAVLMVLAGLVAFAGAAEKEASTNAVVKIRVKVLESGHRGAGDVERWIAIQAAKMGHYSLGGDYKWIELGGKKQQFYGPDIGGRTLEGVAGIDKAGRYTLSVSGKGFGGLPSGEITLAERERKVVRLTDAEEKNATLLAIEAVDPTNQATAAEKHGITTTVTIAKKLRADDPLMFRVELKNASKDAVTLVGADDFRRWKITMKQVGVASPWAVMIPPQEQLAMPVPKKTVLQPGESLEVEVDLTGIEGVKYDWRGEQDKSIGPVAQLRPAVYELAAEIPMEWMMPETAWLVTEPVKVEILPKP